ncbi:hypothetical protein BJX61DRAFT_546679 [Aspergillus egyptiacus]|nr:hypothetical protein BJX61DRAFT_546679 [Aspergillus egyptiacus]
MDSDPSANLFQVDALEGYIPTHSYSSNRADLHCCCGREECAYLQNNHDALEGLEKDLETAARLGQALLHRHESYMAQAEEDRRRFLASIEELEREKRQVQAENARIVEENRSLLEQLDDLNKAVADSDSHAKDLAAALESSEAEVRKLNASAERAADLEAQLAQMEVEQMKLQETLLVTQQDSRTAIQRWKKAEGTLRDLNDQVDRMEKEAREERERHAELVKRMEKRRTVERGLDGAAGRLKGAAATQNMSSRTGGTSVVSRFVKDILEDNANLQMGIIELRELLESSNQEVQNLRDQIVSHQPLVAAGDESERPERTLSQELEANESRRVSKELHIHHHYHTPPVAKKEKCSLFRRSKKRRSMGNNYTLASAQTFPPVKHRPHQPSTSSASTILSQTSTSCPQPAMHRLSLQNPAPLDSMASSPQSARRSTLSIFDRMEGGFDSSQPTSPESVVFTSPLRHGRYKNGEPSNAYRTLGGAGGGRSSSDDEVSDVPVHSVIPEEVEDTSVSKTRSRSPIAGRDILSTFTPHRTARKTTSHESLFSVAGMDIHTPSHRPSRMSDLASLGLPLRVQRRIMSPDRSSPSTSVINAGGEPSKPSLQSPQTLLASVAATGQPQPQPQPPNQSKPQAQAQADETSSSPPSLNNPTGSAAPNPKLILSLPTRVGGWVRGRWGTIPGSSRRDLDPLTEETASAQSSASSTVSERASKHSSSGPSKQAQIKFRSPGVNQKGPVMGLRPPPPPPVSIHAEQLDETLLRETLAE